MKKVLLFLFLFVQILGISAQRTKNFSRISYSQNEREWRKKFINISFTNATMSQDDMIDLKSNYGVAFTAGRTYYLHEPIGDVLRLGVDATWLDLNYTNYDIEHITYWETNKYQIHQCEFSMHIGLSITFEPIKKFAVQAYFRYAPTFAVLYTGNTETFYGNYSSFRIAGGNVSYGAVGLGVEKRFGSVNYKPLGSSGNDNIDSKLSGFRAYLTFKF